MLRPVFRIRNDKYGNWILEMKIRNFGSGSFPKMYLMNKIPKFLLILGQKLVINFKFRKLKSTVCSFTKDISIFWVKKGRIRADPDPEHWLDTI